ncbi:MAG: glycosyltransferase [Planctomycetota bacterium]
MARLRIMHISTRLILGGSQENTVLSCEGQADRGHTVSLVYGPIYGPEGSLLERVKRHGGVETIETPRLVRQVSPVKDLRCYDDLRGIIRGWKPDVVHTHSSKAGILARLAAWKQRVPCVVHTIHGPTPCASRPWPRASAAASSTSRSTRAWRRSRSSIRPGCGQTCARNWALPRTTSSWAPCRVLPSSRATTTCLTHSSH